MLFEYQLGEIRSGVRKLCFVLRGWQVAQRLEQAFGVEPAHPYRQRGGKFNESADINLKKYAWQFGAIDFAAAVVEVLKQAKPIEYLARCFMISDSTLNMKRRILIAGSHA